MLGMDVEAAQVLKVGESDMTEKRVEIKANHCQVLETYNKHMLFGVPTSIPSNVVKQQLILDMNDSEGRIREDNLGFCEKSLYKTKELIIFAPSRKFPTGMPFIKY